MYLIFTVFCAVFGFVYELFSHDVFSPFMGLLFLFPLLLGTLPFYLLGLFQASKLPGVLSRYSYHSGIATLTLGSLLTGVFDIYGSTAPLVCVYWIVGSVLTIGGILIYVYSLSKHRQA